ncbi:MAG: hypothetical protein U9N87_00420 [Planctomycetota bacterium]|nr:hypothetical protein [Planctomycetota bacterium]
MRPFIAPILIAALAACCISGCDSGIPRYDVSGTVTFNGVPVERGEVSLVPQDPKMAPDGGLIENGKFHFVATAGKKTVQIRGARLVPSERQEPDMSPSYEDYIPAQFNRDSALQAEVAPNNDNQFTFDLTP